MQHALRANPAFKTYETLLELGTGEALVSFLDEKGTLTKELTRSILGNLIK